MRLAFLLIALTLALANCATAGPNEGEAVGEAPLPDSDFGFSNFCQNSRQPVETKMTDFRLSRALAQAKVTSKKM